MPKLSVCIPVYNGEKYIKRTMESVLSQSFADFELLIVDNASTDRTVEIAQSLTDSRIRIIQNEENIGMNRNLSKCIQEAKGEYIQTLCADDVLKKNALQKRVELFESNEEIVLVFSTSRVINSKGKVSLVRRFARHTSVFDGKWIVKKAFHSRNIFCEPSNVMVRATIAKMVGEYNVNLKYSLDWEYWSRVCVHGKVGYVADVLMDFTIEPGTTSYRMIQDKKLMKEDDDLFIKSIVSIEALHLGGFDIFRHKFYQASRNVFKKIYIKLFN